MTIILAELTSLGKRIIPESEIGLAILHCSMERHCNPNYDFKTLINNRDSLPDYSNRTVLAPESESMFKESLKVKGGIIPSTGETSESCITPSTEKSSKPAQSHNQGNDIDMSTEPTQTMAFTETLHFDDDICEEIVPVNNQATKKR